MYARGDFSFITGANERAMLEDGFKAVETIEAWNDLKADPGEGGFMYSPAAASINRRITGAMALQDTHSGLSYGWTLRNMQYIAQNGWDAYVAMHLTTAVQN
jgi:hypothetical protein